MPDSTINPPLTISVSFLPHHDPEASVAFYRDLLGFDVRNDVGYDAMRWITIGSSDQPETSIVLYPPFANSDHTEDQRRVITELMANGTFATIILATPDLDATVARLTAGGATMIQKPTDQPWGVRDAAFRDPAGNTVRINHLAG